MDIQFGIMGKIFAVVLAVLVMGVGKFYFKLSNSNPVEVMAEEVIEKETGIDFELTDDVATPVVVPAKVS